MDKQEHQHHRDFRLNRWGNLILNMCLNKNMSTIVESNEGENKEDESEDQSNNCTKDISTTSFLIYT